MSLAATWDAAARHYDAGRAEDPLYRDGLDAAVRAVGSDPGGLVLDCGCGTGLATAALAGRCRGVVALDYSRASLLELRRKMPGVPLVQADVRFLPFRDGAFDRVLCCNTLQHLRPGGQRIAAAELLRVARDRLVVSAHHYARRKRRAGWIKEGRPGQAGIDYIYRFERDEMAALFPGATIGSAGFDGRIGSRLWPRWRRLAARLGIGHMLVASVRRSRWP